MQYFPILSGLFVALLMISQVTAVKPVQVGIAFTGADVIFPLVYLLGDVLTEIYGFARSRIVIWTGLFANIMLSGALWLVGIMPGEAEWLAQGGQTAWDMLLGLAPRIAVASLVAYLVGEFVNSYVLSRLKVAMRGTPSVGAHHRLEPRRARRRHPDLLPYCLRGEWPWSLILQIMGVAYVLKVSVEALMTPVTYAVVSFLKRRTGVDVYDYETNFNPFRITLTDDDPRRP